MENFINDTSQVAQENSFAFAPFPISRLRRLRQSAPIRRLVAETSVQPRNLVLPIFVADAITEPQPIHAMPGVYQHTMDSLCHYVEQACTAGLGAIMLFGVPNPEDKDAYGSAAADPDGILNRAIHTVSSRFGHDIVVMVDTCLDEFTNHGHCGVLTSSGTVANDASIERYTTMAIAQAHAGAQVVSPSGMMDGQVAAIRHGLDQAGFIDTLILAYTAKYCSSFYGPFREAVCSTLNGDRKTYQQDIANRRESLRELECDIAEGADIVMVKPAMSFLDILSDISALSSVPVAAYQVSGEYSMIMAAAEHGWINGDAAAIETVTSIRRAGADIILTYFALTIAGLLG